MTAPTPREPFPAGKQSDLPVRALLAGVLRPHFTAVERGTGALDAAVDDVLSALGSRLVPPDADTRTQWAVRVDEPHPARKEKRCAIITRLAPENARQAPQIWAGWTTVRRTIRTWPGGWRHVGDWLPKESGS